MKITDEQFIGAMRAVGAAEPDNVAPGNYWSASRHAPHCVVGKALGHIDMDLCPRNNNSGLALPLLTALGCSTKVAIAAAVAQYVNDVRQPFKVCLEVFEWALTRVPNAPLSMWEASKTTNDLCREWELRGLMPYIEKPEPIEVQSFSGQVLASKTFATGGFVSGSISGAKISVSLGVCSPTCGFCNPSLTVSMKKDHALIA